MRSFFNSILNLLKREIRFILHDRDLVIILLLSPILYSILYTTVYSNKIEENVPVIIVDNDKSNTSKILTRYLDSHQLVEINEVTGNFDYAVDKINSTHVQGIIYIPENFERSLKSGKGSNLKVYLNTSRFLVSNDINKALNEVVLTFNASVLLKYYEAQGYNIDQAKELFEPIKAQIEPLFNADESYGNFLIPALLVLILQQTLLLGIGESVAKEREDSTLSETFIIAKGKIFNIINGKGIVYFILFSSYALLFFGVHLNIYNIDIYGSAFALILINIFFLIAVIYSGFFIASFFKRKIVSLQVLAFTSYPVFLISGYPWPKEAIPVYIKWISYLIPSTPFLNGMNRIVNMGAGLSDIKFELLNLMLICIGGYFLTHIRLKNFRKVFTNETELIFTR